MQRPSRAPMRAQGERGFRGQRHLRARRRGTGASPVCCRFPGWSVTRRAPGARAGRRSPRCHWRRVHGAGHGAWEEIVALGAGKGERTRSCFRSEHEVRGAHPRCPRERRCRTWDAPTGARTCHAPARWSGRPCGRNLRKCSDPAGGGATARAPAGPRRCPFTAVRNPAVARLRCQSGRSPSCRNTLPPMLTFATAIRPWPAGPSAPTQLRELPCR